MESTVKSLVRGTVILALALGLPAVALFGVPEEVRAWLESDFLPWNAPAQSGHHDHEHATHFEGSSDGQPDDSMNHEPRERSFFARTSTVQTSESQFDAGDQIALASAEARVLHRPLFRPETGDVKDEVVRHVPAPRNDAEDVNAIEERLRMLGANRYQLQRTGDGQFRFVCLCQNQQNEQRTFEAHSADRVQAMRLVLEQITQWREREVFSFYSSGGR
jgi:hypothetical protein